jgi:hypothetical protein
VTTRPASTSRAIAEEIAIAIASEIAIVIVTGIETEIAIVTEIWLVDFDTMIAIAGASRDGVRNANAAGAPIPRGFLSRPIMETTTMGQTRMSRVTAMACTRARAMRGADKLMTRSVRTFTATAAADSFQSSEVLLRTVLRIATVFCGAMKMAIKTGRATSSATGFIAEPISAPAGALG